MQCDDTTTMIRFDNEVILQIKLWRPCPIRFTQAVTRDLVHDLLCPGVRWWAGVFSKCGSYLTQQVRSFVSSQDHLLLSSQKVKLEWGGRHRNGLETFKQVASIWKRYVIHEDHSTRIDRQTHFALEKILMWAFATMLLSLLLLLLSLWYVRWHAIVEGWLMYADVLCRRYRALLLLLLLLSLLLLLLLRFDQCPRSATVFV